MCNVENTNLCDWSQSKNDDLDWMWTTGSHGGQIGGPGVDHTYNSPTGKAPLSFLLLSLCTVYYYLVILIIISDTSFHRLVSPNLHQKLKSNYVQYLDKGIKIYS